MSYLQREKEELGDKMLQYISVLQSQIFSTLKNQLKDKITTRNLEYKIKKIESVTSLNIDLNRIKIHSLFDPNGTKISGSILIVVIAEVPHTDGNLSKNYQFTINFDSTPIRFNFENETFEILDEIGITYITE